jgi:DNA mismatch endonuclease (patch repair protein)
MGFRFRLHRRDLAGTPDIVLPRHKLVIFVHGCFWHRHEGCRHSTNPKTRIEFWEAKFAMNIERDRRNVAALEDGGWTVATVWECETKDHGSLSRQLADILSAAGPGRGIAGYRRRAAVPENLMTDPSE